MLAEMKKKKKEIQKYLDDPPEKDRNSAFPI